MGIDQGGGQAPSQPFDLEGAIEKVVTDLEERKKQAQKIDGMDKDLKFVKGLICDENGVCRLPTNEDLSKANQSLLDEVKKQRKALDALQSKIAGAAKPEKPRGILGTVHRTKEELQACPECQTTLVQDYLGPTGLQKAAEKISENPEACKNLSPDQCKCLLTGVCSILSPEQKRAVEEAGLKMPEKKEAKGENVKRGSFLLSKNK